MTRIYLIRHCQADGNQNRTFQGSIDSDITPVGLKQLERLRERFREIRIDSVYSSPLRRAQVTADAINYYHSLPVKIDAGLREIDGGCWEGKKWSDFPVLYPQMAEDWNLYPWRFAPDGGESMLSVYRRGWSAMLRIARLEKNRAVAVTSHGCTIRNILCNAHGYPIERLNEIAWCDNTAVSIIDFDDDLNCTLVSENDSSHLSGDISTFARQRWWKSENRDKMIFE